MNEQEKVLSAARLDGVMEGARLTLAVAVDAVGAVPYITDARWEATAPITVVEYRRHVLEALERTGGERSAHLPETSALTRPGDPHGVLAPPIPHHQDCPFNGLPSADPDANLCPYCPPLRACEQRVREDERQRIVERMKPYLHRGEVSINAIRDAVMCMPPAPEDKQ